MTVWEDSEVLRACALTSLSIQREYIAVRQLAQKLGIHPADLVPVLQSLVDEGGAECCDWPYEGQMQPHYRITELGKLLAEQARAQWLKDRELLDRLLLGEQPAAPV